MLEAKVFMRDLIFMFDDDLKQFYGLRHDCERNSEVKLGGMPRSRGGRSEHAERR